MPRWSLQRHFLVCRQSIYGQTVEAATTRDSFDLCCMPAIDA